MSMCCVIISYACLLFNMLGDEAKNDPFLGGHLSPNPTLSDQILP
jgi:hypothetical protein